MAVDVGLASPFGVKKSNGLHTAPSTVHTKIAAACFHCEIARPAMSEFWLGVVVTSGLLGLEII